MEHDMAGDEARELMSEGGIMVGAGGDAADDSGMEMDSAARGGRAGTRDSSAEDNEDAMDEDDEESGSEGASREENDRGTEDFMAEDKEDEDDTGNEEELGSQQGSSTGVDADPTGEDDEGDEDNEEVEVNISKGGKETVTTTKAKLVRDDRDESMAYRVDSVKAAKYTQYKGVVTGNLKPKLVKNPATSTLPLQPHHIMAREVRNFSGSSSPVPAVLVRWRGYDDIDGT
ncbi:hypothetical protein DL98DRAFT_317398 [Cadophora sp. DSE1049]|nr:hypothetical protein DL98DRAFT_317398 [Cadophora sp. DSE1049]